jgi:nitrogen fixation NifU-like protein
MESLEEMYQEVILEESSEPYHKVYAIDDPNKSHQYNPSCGDDVTVSVTLSKFGSSTDLVVENLKWSGEGCSISMASTSILAKLVEKKSVSRVRELIELFKELMNSRGKSIAEDKLDELEDASVFVGTSKFPARIKCALLGWVALEGALVNTIGKHGVSSAHSSHANEVDFQNNSQIKEV